ncbi:ATP-binding cassette domain-containing protein [Actinopolymorpha sp. B11F2]|uniref:ABC transporter ATP-binding protein n=1 Tax=Actinopolymorpha sp. B11F2 TaxID=3160862 RepID=UPI0032E4DC1E
MRLVDVHARYARRTPWVLRGVDVELGPGETVVIEGRNGSGKSTLLRVIAGLLPVGRGELSGRPAVVGWLPERLPLGRPFTVRRYLQAMARVQGLTSDEGRARIDELAGRLHLTEFLDTSFASVSQGTRRKVGLTQALLRRPGLLVMDEPWEGLDATSQKEVPALVAEVTAAGGFCVVTDHRGRSGDLGPTRQWTLEAGRVSDTCPVSEDRDVRSEP